MTKQETAQRVADKLWATEHAIDDAMVQALQLIESMVESRRALKLSGTVGEVAQSRAAEAIAALSEARKSIMATHAALDKIQRNIGVVAVGNDGKETPSGSQDDHLRVVS